MANILPTAKRHCWQPILIFSFLTFFVFIQDNCWPHNDKYGGTLVLATTSDPKSFNDIIAKETSTTTVTGLIFEGLTRTNAFTLKVEPHLAERWEVTNDGREWIFYLRRDVVWNDGQPFSADDVVFTFNDLIYNNKIPSSARDIFTLEGEIFKVEKIDDYTVRFTLPIKFAPFLRGMGQAILPKHKLEQSVNEGKFNFTWGIDTDPKEIVGTGPFKLVAYKPGERLVFEKNPLYWRHSDAGDRLPYLSKIIYRIVQSHDAEILKFLEGELDYVSLMRGNEYPLLKPLESKRNFKIYDVGANFGSQFLCFNQNTGINPANNTPYVDQVKSSWFTDIHFRQAVAHAIDKEKMIEILKNGLGYPQNGPMSPSAGFFYNPDVKKYTYDIDRARAILKQAGYQDRDGDGIIEDKGGHKVSFNLYTNSNNPDRIQIAAIIRHDLRQLGMEVNFLPLEFNTLVSKLNATFDWDAIILGLTGGIEPHFGKNVWHSLGQLHMWHPRQAQPATDWEARLDQIFDQGVKELDENKRKELYDEWQMIASEKLPFIYTILGSNIFAIRDKFGNLKPTSYGGAFHNLEEIYIQKGVIASSPNK